VTLADDRVRIGHFLMVGAGTRLELTGGLSLRRPDDRPRRGGRARISPSSRPPTCTAAESAQVMAHVGGSIDEPALSRLRRSVAGSLRYSGLRHSLTDVAGRVRFDRNLVNVDGVRARMAEGDVAFAGNVTLQNYLPDEFNVRATHEHVAAVSEGFSSTVDANLELSGPVASPLLSGRVDVIRSVYFAQLDPNVGLLGLASGGAGRCALGDRRRLVERATSGSHRDPRARALAHDREPARRHADRGSGDLQVLRHLDRPVLLGRVASTTA